MKIFSFTFLGLSALLFARTAAQGHFLQAAFLAAAAAVGVYFLMESFRADENAPLSEDELPSGVTMRALDFEEDDFAHSPLAKTAAHFRSIAQEQAAAEAPKLEPVLVLAEMPSLNKTQSELHAFDEVTRHYRDGKKTLVVSQFHQGRDVTNTLYNHFIHRRPFGDIVCREISENIDLIPYMGPIGLQHADQANLFVIARLREYQRIILLLPMPELTMWRDILTSGYPSVENLSARA